MKNKATSFIEIEEVLKKIKKKYKHVNAASLQQGMQSSIYIQQEGQMRLFTEMSAISIHMDVHHQNS